MKTYRDYVNNLNALFANEKITFNYDLGRNNISGYSQAILKNANNSISANPYDDMFYSKELMEYINKNYDDATKRIYSSMILDSDWNLLKSVNYALYNEARMYYMSCGWDDFKLYDWMYNKLSEFRNNKVIESYGHDLIINDLAYGRGISFAFDMLD